LLSGRDPSTFLSTRSANFAAARQQQPDYFNRSHLVGSSSSASTIVYIIKIFKASPSRITEFVQINESRDESKNQSTDKQFQSDPED
jgi:hypothetical protein